MFNIRYMFSRMTENKDSKDKKEDKNRDHKKGSAGNTSLLQIGVVFLAVVSLFTTANGMKEYIFHDNSTVAYAASAAIQSILLALSMNLPGYLRNIWEQVHFILFKIFLCLAAILLTIVAVFCSSWFSYVYIADVIHRDSWGVDSELLVQQTYRSELYHARDYAHTYRIFLEENMGEKILLLENQTRLLSNSGDDSSVNWEEERENYVINGGTTAGSYMAIVIDAMERVLSEGIGASQENRDIAVTAITDAQENITARMESIQQNIDQFNGNITDYTNRMADLTRRLGNAAEGTDTAALSASINSYARLIRDTTDRQTALQTEYMQLDNALMRLPYYESCLGLASSTSAISIRRDLLQLQSEFFRSEPDEERLLDIAAGIFDNIRNASHLSAEDGTGESVEDALTYTNLLVQMNQLIRNLTEYSEVKDIEADLEEMISDLRLAGGLAGAETETKGSQWKAEWGNRLEDLKAQISAMPVYSELESVNGGESGVLSASQINILSGYDRDQSSANLDDMIRRYIAGHNAIYQGIIYLQSPYRALAIFALILALTFDITGFVFGVVLAGNSQTPGSGFPVMGFDAPDTSEMTEWSIFETLNQYMVLTGDYENRDGTYYYKVFKEGRLEQWPVQDAYPYLKGIYVQDKEDPAKGKAVGGKSQELLFARQPDGPSDGVYRDCRLSFDEGSLILVQEGRRCFLASINDYVPVHSYNPDIGENQTIPARKLAASDIDIHIAVVALNTKGTRVSAIYIIEQPENNRLAVKE